MAQTKRKRRTKHRGTPVGTIESRGRTGRKPTGAERMGAKQDPKAAARDRRMARLDQPPTWRSAANRAAIATVLLIVSMLLIFKQSLSKAVLLAAFALVLYIPLGYYTDLLMYRRRQSKRASTDASADARGRRRAKK